MLDAKDIATIQADLAEVAGDAETPITYRVYLSTTGGDNVLGIPAQDNFNDLSITAMVRELTIEEVQLSDGAYTIGDLEFTVRRTAVSNRDRIVYAGATWEPKEIRENFLGAVLGYRMRCKKA